MNQKFEYYIKKILNRVLLNLISSILLTAILIIFAIIFKFRIGSFYAPYLYILLGLIIFGCILINYFTYKRNMWLLKHYHNDKEGVIKKINYYLNERENSNHKFIAKCFYIFNKRSFAHYKEAIKILEEQNG